MGGEGAVKGAMQCEMRVICLFAYWIENVKPFEASYDDKVQ